jgi:hypothetical protein
MRPALKSATYDAGSDRLTVVVETVKEGEMCTQQIVYRGYVARVTFEGGPPDTVEVVHASMDGRRTVATVEN